MFIEPKSNKYVIDSSNSFRNLKVTWIYVEQATMQGFNVR